MRINTVLGVATILLGAIVGTASAQDGATSLKGEYEIVSGEHEGLKLIKEKINSRVRITDDVITTFDREGKDLYVARYNLNTNGIPWSIAMTFTGGPNAAEEGAKAFGIVKVEGDSVVLCYAPEGGTKPKEFQTAAGTGQNLFVLKRAQK